MVGPPIIIFSDDEDVPQYLPPQPELSLRYVEWSTDSLHDTYDFDSSMTVGSQKPIDLSLLRMTSATSKAFDCDVQDAVRASEDLVTFS